MLSKIMFKITLMVTLLLTGIIFVYAQVDHQEQAKQHYQQGMLLYEEGKFKEAQEQFQKALSLTSPAEPEEKQTVDPEKIIEEKIDLSEENDLEKIEKHYKAGKWYYREKDYLKAKEEFERVVALDADYKDAANYLVRSHQAIVENKIQAEIQAKKQRQERQDQLDALEKEIEAALEKEDIAAAKDTLLTLREIKGVEQKQLVVLEAKIHAKEKEVRQRISKEKQEGEKLKAKTREKEELEEEDVTARIQEYTMDEEDVLDISVWGWSDLHVNVIVRPDGKISFPLVGDVQAVGKTLTELDEEITERLKAYIKVPDVTVMLRKFGGKKVIVLGEVGSPGVYRTESGKSTILEVIAKAGGFSEDAVLSSVIIVRGGIKHPRARRLNLARLNLLRTIEKGDLSENISVESEDLVYVPKKFIADINYFLEEIIAPALDKADFFKAWETKW